MSLTTPSLSLTFVEPLLAGPLAPVDQPEASVQAPDPVAQTPQALAVALPLVAQWLLAALAAAGALAIYEKGKATMAHDIDTVKHRLNDAIQIVFAKPTREELQEQAKEVAKEIATTTDPERSLELHDELKRLADNGDQLTDSQRREAQRQRR